MATHVFKSGIVAPAPGKKRRRVKVAIINGEEVTDQHEIDAAVEAAEGQTYIERMAEQRKQWKEQDQRRFYNPDKDPDAEGIWCVYAWYTPDPTLQQPRWHKVGERRKKPGRRKPMTLNRLFAGIRQALNIRKDLPVKLISKQDDLARKRRNEVWESEPPRHVDTLAPWDPPTISMVTRSLPAASKTKIRKDRSPKLELEKKIDRSGRVTFTFKTRYVGWGRRAGGPWIFLGPCIEQTKAKAKRELRERFPLYPDPVVVAVKDLSYSVRTRLKDGRIVPGQSKINPPTNA